MKTGYDQFFKQAQKVAAKKAPLKPVDSRSMAKQLRGKQEQRIAKKAKKPIRWKMAAMSFLGLIITVSGLLKMDQIESFVQKIEVNVMGTAYAEDTKAAKADSKTKPEGEAGKKVEGKDGKAKEETADATAAAPKEFSQEEINHFAKLNDRKRELDSREEELNRMEQELQTQKTELEKRMSELEQTRKNISTVLEEKVQGDDKKIENLVQLYSNMKPQQAAKAFEDMDEGLAVDILGRMKKKNAAEIMNLVKAEKVKILSEKYAGYKRN